MVHPTQEKYYVAARNERNFRLGMMAASKELEEHVKAHREENPHNHEKSILMINLVHMSFRPRVNG